MQIRTILALAFSVAVFVAGCASEPRPSFTIDEQRSASPPGFGQIRMTTSDPRDVAELVEAIHTLRAERGAPLEVLSLSGGGANGAFGAGVMYGWTERGDRPRFDIVMGVSTGALTAPLAFLGPAYDDALRQAYTAAQNSRLLDFQGLLALFRPSLYRGRPLANLIARIIDEKMVAAVAAEHAKGRRLLVTTSNLDTQELVLWNLGAIAAAGGPESLRLFRQVLQASASVPGVFPPVMIDVETEGRRISEMHVDGSTITSFFAVPESLLFSNDITPAARKDKLYILINGKLGSEFVVTPRATLPIIERSYDTLAKVNTRIALRAVAALGERAGFSVAISSIPQSAQTSQLDFDPARMTALFELGRAQATANTTWRPLREVELLP